MAKRLLKYDFSLNGKGYLLSRPSGGRGRAWHRFGQPDTPLMVNQRSSANAEWGGTDPQLDYPEVWNDWSGGYGHAYRTKDEPDTYHWSENMDARFPNQLVHAQRPRDLYSTSWAGAASFEPDRTKLSRNVNGIVVADISFSTNGYPTDPDGELMVLGVEGWGHLTPRPTATHEWIMHGIVTFTTTAADQAPCLMPPALYGSAFYIGQATGTFFSTIQFDNDIETTSGHGAMGFAVAGNQLWKMAGVGKALYLQNCGNPNGVLSAANWGATYAVGDYFHAIKSLVAVDGQVFAGTALGLFAGDETGTFVNVLEELGGQADADNCRDLAVFEGAVVAPHKAGVFAYRPSTGLVEDLALPHADRSPVSGRVRAVKAYGRYLYAGLHTGSQSWLLSAERKGQTLAWHTLQRMPGVTKVGRLTVDGVSHYSLSPLANSFWVCTEASIDPGGTAPVYWWRMPSLDGNPLAGSPGFSANYCGSARIDFGSTDWGAPGTRKAYRSVEVMSEALASGAQWCDVYYTIDEGPRTKLGTVQRSPKDTLYFRQSANLLHNGGFEVEGAGGADTFGSWQETVGDGAIARLMSTPPVVHSEHGACRLTAGATPSSTYVSQIVRVNPGVTYTLRFWTHGDGTNAGGYAVGNQTQGGWVQAPTSTGVSATNYQEVTFEFTPSVGCYEVVLILYPPSVEGGQAHYDDVSIGEKTTPASTGQSIRLSLESFTASAGVTPVYRTVVLRGALAPRFTDEIDAVVRIADGMVDRQHQAMRPAAEMLRELRDLASVDRTDVPLQLVDLAGATWEVKMLAPPDEQEVWVGQGDDTAPEIAATIRLGVLTYSAG